MRAIVALALLFAAGCGVADSRPAAPLFAATEVRIQPIFTTLEPWTDAGKAANKPDGVQAYLEFHDGFGDPTKASGHVLFELFEYRKDSPDFRGKRIGKPWAVSIETAGEQKASWSQTLRTYQFELAEPTLSPTMSYVLSALFTPTGGRRFDPSLCVIPAAAPTDGRAKPAAPPLVGTDLSAPVKP